MNFKTHKYSLAAIYTLFIISVVLSSFPFQSLAEAEEYKMQGRVVHAGGNAGIAGVRVEVRYSKDGSVEQEKTNLTAEDGTYSFTVPVSKSYVWITYTPADTRVLSTDGRSDVANNANPKDLDTIGLVEKMYAQVSIRGAILASEGAIRYLTAGGNTAIAGNYVMFREPMKFPEAYKAIREDKKLAGELTAYKLVEPSYIIIQ